MLVEYLLNDSQCPGGLGYKCTETWFLISRLSNPVGKTVKYASNYNIECGECSQRARFRGHWEREAAPGTDLGGSNLFREEPQLESEF